MPLTPDAAALLNAWLALEALQPQTFPVQEKLIDDEPPRRKRGEAVKVPPRLLLPLDLESGRMPWDEPAGDRTRLNLADDEAVRWYVPLGFVVMKDAVDLLVKGLEPDGPERERATGVGVLALAAFDEKGFPSTSRLALSSFGWACGEVLEGRIGTLHQFLDIQEDLCSQIADALVERADDGCLVPTTKRGFSAGMSMLKQCLKLPREILERPRVAIRVIGEREKEPVDIINSFFLRDLHRVRTAMGTGGGGQVLDAYLARKPPPERRNVLADKSLLETLVAPGRLPLSRWPAPKPAKLVTLQQAAVNSAVSDLADGGLLSINGPPGTGKTTLLRDLIAAIIHDRADALVEFREPEAAFSAADLVAEGGQRTTLYRLDTRLRGYGIVVASSNNAAVANVSAELPQLAAVASDFTCRHFAGTADLVQDREGSCWGLIAAVLGNKANRTEFVEDAWWHAEWGLEKYLAAVTGRVGKDRAGRPPPKIVEAEQPPTRAAARERWRQACFDYREKRAVVAHMQALREQIRTAIASGAAAQQAVEDAHVACDAAVRDSAAATETRERAETALSRAEAAIADARRLIDGNTALQPGALSRFLGLDAKWRQSQELAVALMHRSLDDRDAARTEKDRAQERMATSVERAEAAQAALGAAKEKLAVLQELEAQSSTICQGTQAGPGFWESPHETIHTASPWADADFTAARDDLFAAAMRLHRAFIDAAAWPLKSNLQLMMDHLKGRRVPSGAHSHLGDLWDSFFLVVPLVSTTFASFDRLMEGMGQEAIGWLIVDEAGQAPPQAAVGALWRSRRALVIGDPLQIEPVSKVPAGLIRAVCDSYGAHPDIWAAPRASAQTLADAASPLMARMGSGTRAREIGIPLLVHRRCQDPMFSISNEIAYDGLMVHAAGDPASAIAEALSPWLPAGSSWLDVTSNAEKWSRKEGEATVDLLRKLATGGIRKPSLYVISPFRDVADKLRNFVVKSGVPGDLGIPEKEQKAWAEKHIGTVHTFQGKEAEAVLLVLGASAAASRGSRNWAGGTPNILNVAATRAKKVIYVISHHAAWANAGVFAAAAELPVVRWPFGSGEEDAPDPGDEEPMEAEAFAVEDEKTMMP